MTYRFLAFILGAALWGAVAAAPVSAQELNCGFDAFPIGGCVTPSGTSTTDSDDQFYAGIQFAFGKNGAATPKLVAGVRHLELQSGGDVLGADANVRVSFLDGLAFDSGTLSFVGGSEDILANAGVGYSFAQDDWLAVGALQVDYIRVGADFSLSQYTPTYFAEINSAAMPDFGTGIECASGFYPRTIDIDEPFPGSGDQFFVLDPGLLVDRTTCVPNEFDFIGGGEE
jgi:hypothetical protein